MRCKYFMQGACKYKDKTCPYYHPEVCSHFKKGTCKFGEACKDLHGQQRPIQKARKAHQVLTSGGNHVVQEQSPHTASVPQKKSKNGRKQSSSGKSSNGSTQAVGKKAKKSKKSIKKDSGHAKKKQSQSPR